MRTLLLCFVAALVAVITAPTALADGGPLTVVSGGSGVVAGTTRYIPVNDPSGNTELLAISTRDGTELNQLGLVGEWGLPYTPAGAEGLSHDGKTLVLADSQSMLASPSTFLIVNTRQLRLVRTVTLRGYFSFDALSPNASRMYLIQYAHGASGDTTHYIVRGYDLRTNRLLPGKIADRKESEETMAGSPMTRTTSAGGRWVYTLYQKPSGEQFIHALDTVGSAAYCIDLPRGRGLFGVLSLRNHDRTLGVYGRPGHRLEVAVGSWLISYPRAAGFPWAWLGAGIGGGLALLAAGGLVLRRRRDEELQKHAAQELGLA